MTGILLTLALLILLTACLYLVVARPDLVAGWLYRLLGPRRWLRVDPYPDDAAEAPDPLDEHFSTAPRVVAGQDIDDSILVAELQAAYAQYRAGEDVFAGAIHEPSPEVKQ